MGNAGESEQEGYYLITFKDYRNSIRSLDNAPKPAFKVILKIWEIKQTWEYGF